MEIIKFYSPLASFIIFMIFALKSKIGGDSPFVTLGQFGFDIVITNKTAGRIILILLAIFSILSYVYMDISRYFPSNFEMEVFYDRSGINNSTKIFSNEELKKLDYRGENTEVMNEYYKSLDVKLKQILNYSNFFSIQNGVIHSKGTTSFKVKQTDGIQKYYIEESRGELTHTMERPDANTSSFMSFFDKMPSPNDYLRPSLSDILINNEVVIAPKFKQILAEKNKSDGVIFDHILIGATKIYLLPYPHYSNTVYFLETPSSGVVPIGYAVYK